MMTGRRGAGEESVLRSAAVPILLAAVLGLPACANPSDDDDIVDGADADADADGDADADEASVDDGPVDRPWTPPTDSLVYVNTETTLYYIDPAVSLDLVEVGDFAGPCTGGSGFYDIALDGEANMVGIAAEGLYSIDRETAACALLRAFPDGSPHFFSLSYVTGAHPSAPDMELLFAASVEQGEWVNVNPAGTTVAEMFVSFGFYDPPDYEYVSSGDIVSIQVGPDSYRTFATLKCSTGYTDPGCESDWLVEVTPRTGAARFIGQTGFQQIFGLGFWGDRVYGFTNAGEHVLIDVDTGAGELVRTYTDRRFWGAGTTTRPYVLI
jgi:hypothetical protein